MKKYRVYIDQIVTSTKAFDVEAEDEEHAHDLARAESENTDWDDEETNTEWELREDLTEEIH